MPNSKQIAKEAITTDTLSTGGLLNPEQSSRFLRQVFEQTALGGMVRNEMRRVKTGEIDKIGIASRILRPKVENIDANADGTPPTLNSATGQITGYRANPITSVVPYACKAVRLPWEITNETLRQNIEGQGYEQTTEALMVAQAAIDTEDLCLNGDTSTDAGDADATFLRMNDGWIKKIQNGGHIVDLTALENGTLNQQAFNLALLALPAKYNSGSLRWLVSPHTAQKWTNNLLNAAVNGGGNVPDSMYTSPFGIPIVQVPRMPDDKIMLVNPRNLIKVGTYDVQIRKTNSDVRSIMEDKTFYVIHFDLDSIVEELDAVALITGVDVTGG
ncbi:MAG: hypothetical protein LBT21_06320 [Oscillospiraceae bacterium]|nr:hypothetical protein [Oscillospiraceae bacterium]